MHRENQDIKGEGEGVHPVVGVVESVCLCGGGFVSSGASMFDSSFDQAAPT